MDYAEQIEELLADLAFALELRADSDEIFLDEIISLLGCRSVETEYTSSGDIATINNPPQPNAIYEPLVAKAFLEVFRANAAAQNHNDTSDSILDGLLTNDRWKLCINTADDARSFVRMLAIFYLGFNANDPDHILLTLMLDDVQEISLEWLHFDGDPSDFTPATCVRLAFGNVWCDLFVGDLEAVSFDDLFAIVSAERPTVMPALLPANLTQDAAPLPVLEI